MNGYLLDTNVVSEIMRTSPNPNVIRFLDSNEHLWISTIVLHELEFGLQAMPVGRKQSALHNSLARFSEQYKNRILPICRDSAIQAASLRVQSRKSGRTLELGDALIAGAASANHLVLATRNLKDFEGLSIDILNPWQIDDRAAS
ncbi:MAG: type II toxin-antitoxin system VapC family toxin [Gammaproteobacteria bacterium]|nr:type II toxin-antitoxin system VapC family toxin [Gammaproteobacteria bacterium]MCY4269674.1 type II toxin-antitoxin system VapC family toxin [Gammaproteobacteria bacterium]MCY4297489.1 type II toxin-antitoxin system VapC family toxin [Gammaproteobacteria bacterium]